LEETKKTVSSEGFESIKLYAAKEMMRMHQTAPRSLPTGVQFVGGDVISVVYQEGDKVYSSIFHWDDVKDLVL